MRIRSYGNKDSDLVIIKMSGAHEAELIEREESIIKEMTDRDFLLLTCFVDDWNRDLSPWEANPVFGNEPFEGGAGATLEEIKNDVISCYPGREFIIGGYSLAGLFALWAAYQTDSFCGVASASPSVWYPDFLAYATGNDVKTDTIYLSLGDREAKTKNKIMQTVGYNIKSLHDQYDKIGIKTTLEWNEGNHFKDPEVRMAKGFAWVINNLDEQVCSSC
ncbi:MAG: esterase [Lachnospiraceae bacterium]|nr:esterase [Lachnospiraceae bacterium]